MNDLTALKNHIVKVLFRALSGSCDVLSAYPGTRPLPLGRPAVAVSLDSVELSPAGLGGFAAIPSREQPGTVAVTLRLDLFEPEKSGGGSVHTLYESLCAALLSLAPSIGLTRLSCEPLVWDEAVRAWRLPAKAVVHGALTGATPAAAAPQEGEITHIELQQRREPDVP